MNIIYRCIYIYIYYVRSFLHRVCTSRCSMVNSAGIMPTLRFATCHKTNQNNRLFPLPDEWRVILAKRVVFLRSETAEVPAVEWWWTPNLLGLVQCDEHPVAMMDVSTYRFYLHEKQVFCKRLVSFLMIPEAMSRCQDLVWCVCVCLQNLKKFQGLWNIYICINSGVAFEFFLGGSLKFRIWTHSLSAWCATIGVMSWTWICIVLLDLLKLSTATVQTTFLENG